MKVWIKSFDVGMEVKNSGVEFEVYSADGTKHQGDFVLTKSAVIWCEGRTKRENGKRITWDKFIELMNAQK
jgi:hypothetical protein